MEQLAKSGITPEAVAIDGEGCSFIIDSRDGGRFASAVHELNVAVKLHDHCARVALTRTAMDWPLPSLGRVIQAFDDEGIALVHLSSDASVLAVLVDEGEVDRVVGLLARFCQPAVSRS